MTEDTQEGLRAESDDPALEILFEEAARDTARLRKQLGLVTLASGLVLVVAGLIAALGALAMYVQSRLAADSLAGGAATQVSFIGVAIVVAALLLGAGVWFVLKGLAQSR